jgi:hypothetical protein
MKRIQSILNYINLLIIVLLLFNIFASCKNDIKFEKSGWTERESEGAYPYRAKMLNDLITNYRLTGLSHRQIINLMGEPENYINKDSSIYYEIVVKFRSIDPVYRKNLEIQFDRDSLVKNFKINIIKH